MRILEPVESERDNLLLLDVEICSEPGNRISIARS